MRKACLNAVFTLAQRDPRVAFIGSDLSPDLLERSESEHPDRFFMEGVSEQHVVGMAAGLAMEGFVPYVNTIATFLTRRCYEQVAVDLCIHDLPVRLIANGGGYVYAPLGPTHQAIEDIAIMRALPNMTVVCPADAEEMVRFMDVSLDWPHPIYIRMAKGGDPVVTKPEHGFEIGKGYMLREEGEVLLVGTGVGTTRALGAADILSDEGVRCRVLHMPTVKPLDEALLVEQASTASLVVTVEEHVKIGGLGSAVADCLLERMEGRLPKIRRIGIPDVFADKYGGQDDLMERYGLQPPAIAETVRAALAG
jgi:transketolase